MITVALLFGGRSGEHEVSCCSAASVFKALDKEKYQVTPIGIDHDGRWYVQDQPEIKKDKNFGDKLFLKKDGEWLVYQYENNGKLKLHKVKSERTIEFDVVLPIVHGTFCEDGTLQGLLEMVSVPFVGPSVLGSSVGMDKDVTKRLLRDANIPVTPGETVLAFDWQNNRENLIEELSQKVGFPCFAKPANAGSSVGIKKVKSKEDLAAALNFAFQYDNKVLLEQGIDCVEVECAVLGNENPQASCLGQIVPHHEFYSYEAKYIDSNGAATVIPAKIDETLTNQLRSCAVDAFKALCCSSMARIDFFIDKKTGKYYLNEINTLPGFTSISMYPQLWEKSGIPYNELLDRLIEFAFDYHKKREALKFE